MQFADVIRSATGPKGGTDMFSLTHPPRSLADLKSDIGRIALGTVYALRPRRIAALPVVLAAALRVRLGLERADACLDERRPAARHPLGFVGVCGDLDPESLMKGFSRGLYPFSHVGGKKWWLHPERMTLAPHEVVRDKDVRRMLRNKRFRVSFDREFEAVMRACAEPRPGSVPLTWITEDIIAAYARLSRQGHAHSFEVWNDERELVGGGFGIAVGPVFVIESQFTRQRNASKIGMVTLMRHLSEWGFVLADGKGHTPYLEQMGFQPTKHDAYLEILGDEPVAGAASGAWRVDDGLDASEAWEPNPAAMNDAVRRRLSNAA